MDTKHTPTPWPFGNTADAIVAGDTRANAPGVDYYGGTLVAESLNHADRDFVVRAVNSHAQLVAALNRAILSIENLGHCEGGLSGRDELEKACDQMTAALAEAGAA